MSGRREILDDTPIEVPAGFRRPESLTEQIQRMVRTQISEAADRNGHETFKESQDFEVDEDFDLPMTAAESRAMELEYPTEEDRNVVSEAAQKARDAKEPKPVLQPEGAGGVRGKTEKKGGAGEESGEDEA